MDNPANQQYYHQLEKVPITFGNPMSIQPLIPLEEKLWVTGQANAKMEQRTVDLCIPHHGLIGTRTTVTDCQRDCILLTIAEERKSLIIARNEKGKEICSLQSTRPNVDIRRFISSSHSKKYSNTTKNIYSDRKKKKLLFTID